MYVTAKKSFEHNGTVRRGEVFPCSDIMAHELKRAGLVEIINESINPTLAGALLPSALPPVPALPQTIVNLSDSGNSNEKKKPGRKKKQP